MCLIRYWAVPSVLSSLVSCDSWIYSCELQCSQHLTTLVEYQLSWLLNGVTLGRDQIKHGVTTIICKQIMAVVVPVKNHDRGMSMAGHSKTKITDLYRLHRDFFVKINQTRPDSVAMCAMFYVLIVFFSFARGCIIQPSVSVKKDCWSVCGLHHG